MRRGYADKALIHGRLASPRGMDPESFTYEEKESYVRFAPFMGMRSCALEPRSEMQGCAPSLRLATIALFKRASVHYSSQAGCSH